MGAWPAVFVFGATLIKLLFLWGPQAAILISLSISILVAILGGAVTVVAGLTFNQIIYRKERVE